MASGEELAELGGADVLLVTTNAFDVAEKARAGLRVSGRVVLSGLDFSKPFSISSEGVPFRMMRQQVIGSTHGGQHYLSEVLDLAAKGKVKPILETFSLDQATEAYDRLASGKMRFRGVFTPRSQRLSSSRPGRTAAARHRPASRVPLREARQAVMRELHNLYVDGRWSAPVEHSVLELSDPATGRPSGHVALGGVANVDRAVTSARRAFPAFAATTAAERVDLLEAVGAEYARRAEDMAQPSPPSWAPRWPSPAPCTSPLASPSSTMQPRLCATWIWSNDADARGSGGSRSACAR